MLKIYKKNIVLIIKIAEFSKGMFRVLILCLCLTLLRKGRNSCVTSGLKIFNNKRRYVYTVHLSKACSSLLHCVFLLEYEIQEFLTNLEKLIFI